VGGPQAAPIYIIAGFYKYAVEEEVIDHSPAVHVRRPRVDYESHAVALDRNELGALLVAAGLGSPAEHALISLLALNGLRVSEAVGATSRTWAWNAGTGP
jgi:site-specific recombinase XerD